MSRNRPPWHGGTPAPAVDEARLQDRIAPVRARWEARSRDEALTESQRLYAARRTRKLGRPWYERTNDCARAGVIVRCQCPGRRDVRWYTCRQHLLCSLCRKQRARKMRPRIWAALEARLRDANDGRHHLVMVTLTIRPTGDVARDRDCLMTGWRAYYKANHRRWGAFAYVGVPELHRSGTPHLHVVCVWPKGGPGDGTQGDWEVQRELWLQSCPESERVVFTASNTPARAARYVSKYVSKGVQTSDFTPQMRADVVAAAYNQRWVFGSRKVWEPFTPCCPDCRAPVTRARFTFPSAPPRSMAERLAILGWTTERHAHYAANGSREQTAFAFPEAIKRGGAGCP